VVLDSLDLASDRHNLGMLYSFTKRFGEAVPLLQKALEVRMKALGPRNVDTQSTLANYVLTLRHVGRNEEAYEIEKRIPGQ